MIGIGAGAGGVIGTGAGGIGAGGGGGGGGRGAGVGGGVVGQPNPYFLQHHPFLSKDQRPRVLQSYGSLVVITGAGVGTGMGGSVVTGSELSCGSKYKSKGNNRSINNSGMRHTQMLLLKLVGTATISKSPAPWPTYLYVVSCL